MGSLVFRVVIAAGSGTVKEGGTRVPLDIKTGDVILFGKYTSQEIKIDGEDVNPRTRVTHLSSPLLAQPA